MSGIMKPPFGAQINLSHPLAQGLVGCWLFNEGSGNQAHDLSGKENQGTLTNMANPPTPTSGWNAGLHGGALAFDGIDDFVDCGNRPSFDIVNGITISFWIYFTAKSTSGHYPYLIGKSSAYNLYLDENSLNINSRVYIGGVSKFGTLYNATLNKWYHVVITYDKTQICVYANGKPLDPVAQTGSIDSNTSSFKIGAQYAFFIISSASIYNRALSANEVAYLYAFPYCMFEEIAYPAWMAPPSIPIFMQHYRRLSA